MRPNSKHLNQNAQTGSASHCVDQHECKAIVSSGCARAHRARPAQPRGLQRRGGLPAALAPAALRHTGRLSRLLARHDRHCPAAGMGDCINRFRFRVGYDGVLEGVW